MLPKCKGLWLVLSCVVSAAFGNSTILGELATLSNNATLLGFIMAGRASANSEFCKQSLQRTAEAMAAGREWALRLFDASGKLPSGLELGPTSFMGSYEECLRVESGEPEPFSGKYCKVFLEPAAKSQENIPTSVIDTTYRWDVCVPSTCREEDIRSSLSDNVVISSLGIDVPGVQCENSEALSINGSQIVAIVLFSFLGLFLICGTAMDVVRNMMVFCGRSNRATSTGNLDKALRTFSLYTNSCKVLDASTPDGNLTALNGIRFLSTTWIIMYHFFYFFNFFATKNTKEVLEKRFDFAYQVVLNSLVSVDTFFFISGLLVAYVNLRKLEKTSINWFEFYFHRYWRLTFPVAFVTVFTFLWPFLGSGPNWEKALEPDVESCRKNWWTNLIYINNFYGLDMPCLNHLWYLSNDMQFYIVSPLIFYALHRWTRVGLFLNAFFLVVTMAVPGILGTVYDLQPTTLFFMKPETMGESFEKIYTKPYCRMGPYCVGIFLGYILVTKKNITLKPSVQVGGWAVAIICCVSSVYGVYNWNCGNYGNLYVNSLYLATHRTVWAIGVAWMTFACATGYGGLINSFLSSKVFVPLSRLTYVAYLVHPMIVKGFVGYQRDSMLVSQFLWVTIYLGLVCITFGISFVVTLCVEVPFLGLEKVLLHRRKTSKDKQDETSAISEKENPALARYNSMGTDNGAFTLEN